MGIEENRNLLAKPSDKPKRAAVGGEKKKKKQQDEYQQMEKKKTSRPAKSAKNKPSPKTGKPKKRKGGTWLGGTRTELPKAKQKPKNFREGKTKQKTPIRGEGTSQDQKGGD